jgi:hypothetical protein
MRRRCRRVCWASAKTRCPLPFANHRRLGHGSAVLGLLIVPSADHVDLYDRKDVIPFDELDELFTKNLA